MKLLSKFSSWIKLTHVVAYMLRFINRCKAKFSTRIPTLDTPSKLQVSTPPLSVQEINLAKTRILLLTQQEAFTAEIALLQKKQLLSQTIQRLKPFLDAEGLIRVGGRLSNSSLVYNAKHPILLPKRHCVTDLLIDYHHAQYLHCGPQQLQAMLSQKYWILSARGAIRSRIFRCVRCFKCRPVTRSPQMADLPASRVSPTRAFNTSAVDYAGPFSVKAHYLRRIQIVKIYVCLFICLSTKAVHLEVVSDLTSEAFIASLTRFVSRRGLVSHLYSDNATNFVGAARQLRETVQKLVKQDETQLFLTERSIEFHFIPARAPHFGGIWERAIQSAKNHMRRVIGEQVLTLEEFITLSCQVEAMLNSRPIVPMSSDPCDLEVLTPGHFITGGPLVSIPEESLVDVPTNRLRRWKLVTAFAQHIWQRWHREYLHTLQNRPKWIHPQENLKKGDLVLIHEDNTPPLRWKMGRVTNVFPGKDDVIRVAEVKMASGLFTRPVVKLSPLPLD